MVMDRFGTDLQKKFEENGRKFPRKLVLQLGIRLVGFLSQKTDFFHLQKPFHSTPQYISSYVSVHHVKNIYVLPFDMTISGVKSYIPIIIHSHSLTVFISLA